MNSDDLASDSDSDREEISDNDMEQELAELLGKKDELLVTVQTLVKTAGRVNEETRVKEEEARKLTKRVERLLGKHNPHQDQGQPLSQEASNGTPNAEWGAKDATLIFPEEVWKIIFQGLSNPGDLWNLCNSCKHFENILRPWKTGWMLEQSLPYLYQHLPGSKLLECRLVSKSWNGAMDSFLENHPSIRPHDDQGRDHRRVELVYPLKEKSICLKNNFTFCKGQWDNSAILADPKFPQKVGHNPFIGRYVTLALDRDIFSPAQYEDHPGDPWWEQVFTFLDSFGQYIWYLDLVFPTDPNVVQEKLADFMHFKLFQAVPNLRRLNTEFPLGGLNEYGLDINLLLPPIWKQLNSPYTCDVNFLYVLLKKYGSQLRKLHLNGSRHNMMRDMTLDKLQELIVDMEKMNGDYEESSRYVSEIIDGLLEVGMPNLTMLQLTLPEMLDYDYSFEDLLKVINKLTTSTKLSTLRLGSSLENLRFATEDELRRIASNSREFSLEPSTLRTLEIEFCWGNCSGDHIPPNYNFLIRCFPHLENLIISSRNKVSYQWMVFTREG